MVNMDFKSYITNSDSDSFSNKPNKTSKSDTPLKCFFILLNLNKRIKTQQNIHKTGSTFCPATWAMRPKTINDSRSR